MATAEAGIAVSLAVRAFHGGVRLARFKEGVRGKPSCEAPLPQRLIFPLHAHVGTPTRPVVRVGQCVLRGELIAAPGAYVSQAIHASTSGVVAEIGAHPVAHPSGLSDTCIVLEADGEGSAVEPWPALDFELVTLAALQARIVDAGIIGMGGAGFPSHVKLKEGMGHSVRMLIINGVECEPYINCDDCLMRERAAHVVSGARMLKRAVQAEACVIAVEEDMPEAAAALAPFLGDGIELALVPAIYPAGGEKQLIMALTGMEVPTHGLPIQAGIVMHNVATAVAVYEAVALGQPLTARMITVTGGVANPANVWTPIGTPISHLIDYCGRVQSIDRVIVGGPMMGTAVLSEAVPVGKTTNCVLALRRDQKTAHPMPCIRCGECVEVCPARLQPQALYEFARAKDWDSAQNYYLFDCIECGACAYVCPSNLPLVHYYRYAKSEIEALESAQARSIELKQRFETRQSRLESEGPSSTITQEEELEPAEERPSTQSQREVIQQEVAEAIARGRAKRQLLREEGAKHGSGPDEGPQP